MPGENYLCVFSMAVVFSTSLMKLVLVKLVITEHSYSIVQLITIYHILSNFLLEPRNFKKLEPLGLGEFTEVMHKEGALYGVEVIGRWFHLEADAEIAAAQKVEYFNRSLMFSTSSFLMERELLLRKWMLNHYLLHHLTK